MKIQGKFIVAATTMTTVALLAGCGSKSSNTAPVTVAVRQVATGAAAGANATISTPTAAQVVARFTSAHLPVVNVITYTATSDPNNLLGRPNEYTSKTSWSDTRIPASETVGLQDGDTQFGGSVEVFPNVADAQARENYIQSVLKSMPALGTEYDYIVGDALIRVSGLLTPAQAAQYASAAR